MNERSIERTSEKAVDNPQMLLEMELIDYIELVEVEAADEEKAEEIMNKWLNSVLVEDKSGDTSGVLKKPNPKVSESEIPALSKQESIEETNDNETGNDENPLVNNGEQFDENGKLRPNIRYRTDDGEGRDYIYETDDKGRIVKVTTKNLQLKNREGRLTHEQNTPEKKDTDDAGHLIADRFGGSPKLDNLISQDRDLNRNRGDYANNWYNMEGEWADAIADGKTVEVEIVITHAENSERPSSFEVYYVIDGDMQVKSFDNNPKGANS